MIRRSSVVAIAAALLVLSTGGWAVAQHQMQHQQQHQSMMQNQQQNMGMQGQMSQMSGMMQNMSQIMERANDLSQTLGSMMKMHQGSMGEQMQTMQQMSQSIGAMAEQMKANMQRYDHMLQNGGMMNNKAMQQQMQGFRGHMEGMAKQMGQALDSLESMTKTLQQNKSNQ